MDASINSSELQSALASEHASLVIDVRKADAFRAASRMIAGALRREPERASSWPQASTVVVYCARGHGVSQGVVEALRATGFSVRYLAGGIEDGWRPAGGNFMH